MPQEPGLPSFFERDSLNVDVYDARAERDIAGTSCEGDVAFFVEEARRRGGPVLELGAGTGRVTFPIAEAGMDIVGLDLSHAMLARAAAKREAMHEPARSRVRFVHGDMSRFDVPGRFGVVFAAFRAFQAVTTPEAQRNCLVCAHRHLVPGGTLIVDLFDPRVEWLAPGTHPSPRPERARVRHPRTGNDVTVLVLERTNDPFTQTFAELWRHQEIDASGRVVRSEDEILSLRWTYREEMRYLLDISGFDVEALYSDFRRSPPAYGNEQVWVARRRG